MKLYRCKEFQKIELIISDYQMTILTVRELEELIFEPRDVKLRRMNRRMFKRYF